jgi:hypothetical protein
MLSTGSQAVSTVNPKVIHKLLTPFLRLADSQSRRCAYYIRTLSEFQLKFQEIQNYVIDWQNLCDIIRARRKLTVRPSALRGRKSLL